MGVLNPSAGGTSGKESACNAGDPGSVPRSGRSLGEGNGNPFQYSCLEKAHGQMSLVAYKESQRVRHDRAHRYVLLLINSLTRGKLLA